jgi:predicted TIM-barrel enzyme/catechol 2,3-dioxygenase-like lactoylglutathione lyase family enzyme
VAVADRTAILARLAEASARGEAILGAGCSAGIVAKCAELGGADLILVYSTGRSRLMGLPTWRLGNSNPETIAMSREILNVVGSTPIIGGLEACDPTRLDLESLLDDFVAAGFSGVINFPTLSNVPDMRRRGDAVGIGFSREVEMIRQARGRGIFTMAYVASPDDSRAMADAGADCIVSHSGPTAGGLSGYPHRGSLDEVLAAVEEILQAARETNPDVICLVHGGPLASPAQVSVALRRTSAVGFVGASSIERIPIERAVVATTQAFKRLSLSDDGVGEVRVRSVSVRVRDIAYSQQFYASVFGQSFDLPQSNGNGGEASVVLDLVADGDSEIGQAPTVRLEVVDLEVARRVLVNLRVDVADAVTPDGGRALRFRDPDGLQLELVESSFDGEG